MAPNFRPYDDQAGRETRARWSQSLDGIFEAYQASKQNAQVQGRLTQQDALAADQRANAERDRQGQVLLNGGVDPRTVTPQNFAQAQAPAAPQESPVIAAIRAHIEKRKTATTMASQEQQLGMDKTRSGLAVDQSQIRLNDAKAKAEASANGPAATAKRPATTEYAARGFADKANQANTALDAVIEKGFNPSSPWNRITGMLPNEMASPEFQQTDQALRQFVNSILRRESGAAIPDSELANYRKQYAAMPGDSPDVLKQKAAARKLAIAGLEAEGSRVPSNVQPSGNGPAIGTEKKGYRFKGGDPADKNSWVAI